MKNEIDCYGYLYEELLSPCRDRCAIRCQCRRLVEEKLAKFGKEQFENRKNEIVLASQALAKQEPVVSARFHPHTLRPEITQIVSEVIDLCQKLKLKSVQKKYYIVLKDQKNKSMLHVSRLQSYKLTGLVRFVRFTNRCDFPTSIQKWISQEKCCGQHYFVGEDFSDLEMVLRIYLEAVCNMKGTVYHGAN